MQAIHWTTFSPTHEQDALSFLSVQSFTIWIPVIFSSSETRALFPDTLVRQALLVPAAFFAVLSSEFAIVHKQERNWGPDAGFIRSAAYLILGPCVRTAPVAAAPD